MLGSLAVLSLAVFAAAQKVYSAKEDGLSQHTIYMPDTAGKIPILVWSSGGCIRDGGAQHAPALKEASSHGTMIIALGNLRGGGGKGKGGRGLFRRQGKGGKGMGGMGGNVALQNEAFTWIEKNAGKGKYAKLDKTRVAIAGQSCGGLESYTASGNPMVKVIGIFNSGEFSTNPIVTKLTKPVFYFLGGEKDIAYKNGERDYKELPKTTPTWKGNLPVGHMATYMQPRGGKFGTAMAKWLEWTLRGNATSAQFFTGNGAKADGWSVESRNLNKISVTPIG